MLIRLMPEQVAEHWDEIKEAIAIALPPMVVREERALNRILESMLIGSIHAWVAFRGDTKEVMGLLTTTVIEDNISKTKNLLLYTVYAEKQTSDIDWTEGFEAVSKFALKIGCDNVVAYTKNADIIKIARHFNADESIFLTFPLR